MHVVIPMAGSGDRFVSAGYREPKPIITVNGRKIIEYICDMYDRDNDDFVFICNDVHLELTDMRNFLSGLVKHSTILSMPQHKLGPVYTVLAFSTIIPDNSPVIVSYCDNPLIWNYNEFKDYVKDIDGCIVSHTGFHPHTLSSTMYAYSKTDSDNKVLEIKEKDCYTSDRFKEHASGGVYYFRYGEYVKRYFKRAIQEDVSYKGEYYVTLVYNLMIQDGLKVNSYLTDYVLAFGTPNEVQNFEAWQTILSEGQVKSEADLIKCYNYWKTVKAL